jgi:hypothetical protein
VNKLLKPAAYFHIPIYIQRKGHGQRQDGENKNQDGMKKPSGSIGYLFHRTPLHCEGLEKLSISFCPDFSRAQRVLCKASCPAGCSLPAGSGANINEKFPYRESMRRVASASSKYFSLRRKKPRAKLQHRGFCD